MLLEPPVDVEVVVLLGPEHARERLAVDALVARRAAVDPLVELVGVGGRCSNVASKPAERVASSAALSASRRRTTALPPAGTSSDVVGRGLGPVGGIDRVGWPMTT